jgi:hypothetical protein
VQRVSAHFVVRAILPTNGGANENERRDEQPTNPKANQTTNGKGTTAQRGANANLSGTAMTELSGIF